MNFLYDNYGPSDINDVAIIKERITNANADHGYYQLFTIHDECLNQLRQIQKIDPTTGNKLFDNNNVPIFHNIEDSDLKSILIRQIKDTDIAVFQLKVNAQSNPSITYTDLKKSINNLLKDAKSFNLIDWHNNDNIINNNDDTNIVKANANKSFNNSKKTTFKNNNTILPEGTCKNCNGAHYVKSCPSKQCNTCGNIFETAKHRAYHYRITHVKRKFNNNDNNSDIKEESNHNNNNSKFKNSISAHNTSVNDF
jgi:hypothetical protein